MDTKEASGKRVSLLSAAMLFWLFLAGVFSAEAALAQPEYGGEEPPGGPIIYNLIPGEGEVVARDEVGRAGVTIETQHDTGIAWAGVFVDGQHRPGSLMGPTRYYQSVSVDISDLGPGVHSVWVIAVDSQGRVGSYSWSFVVI